MFNFFTVNNKAKLALLLTLAFIMVFAMTSVVFAAEETANTANAANDTSFLPNKALFKPDPEAQKIVAPIIKIIIFIITLAATPLLVWGLFMFLTGPVKDAIVGRASWEQIKGRAILFGSATVLVLLILTQKIWPIIEFAWGVISKGIGMLGGTGG